MEILVKEQAITWFKFLGGTKKVIKVGKISEKGNTLTVEGKRISLIGNGMKRILEMTPRQRQLEVRKLKSSKIQIKKN